MKYAGIINNDVVNGYDVCVSYWCQGCRFRCPGCHNPQTWDFADGIDIDEYELLEKIMDAIGANGIHRNLSILGGEPLCEENIAFTTELIDTARSRYPGILIFLWTGYVWEELPNKDFISNYVDVVVDGLFDIGLRDITLPFRGSSNQRVIDVKATVAAEEVVLYETE